MFKVEHIIDFRAAKLQLFSELQAQNTKKVHNNTLPFTKTYKTPQPTGGG